MNENYRMDDMEDGFESDEELKNDLLDGRPEGWEDIMAINAINVRKKLDPAVELPKKPHSLEPDMIGGYSISLHLDGHPKSHCQNPSLLPLITLTLIASLTTI